MDNFRQILKNRMDYIEQINKDNLKKKIDKSQQDFLDAQNEASIIQAYKNLKNYQPKKTEKSVLADRTSICGNCNKRIKDKCSSIDCFIDIICDIPVFTCPEGKW